jgi:hypothetical protein
VTTRRLIHIAWLYASGQKTDLPICGVPWRRSQQFAFKQSVEVRQYLAGSIRMYDPLIRISCDRVWE